MKSCLIGGSGLIGTSLAKNFSFDAVLNSASPQINFSPDLVACAAPSGVKWRANQDPKSDLQDCLRVFERIETLKPKRVVLISTVDVYANPSSSNEISPVSTTEGYGRNRFLLETLISQLVGSVTILRLGGVVDLELKKNPLFDLKHRRLLDRLNPTSRMQFIPLDLLAEEFGRHQFSDYEGVLNVTSPPVTLDQVSGLFGVSLLKSEEKRVNYDVSSIRLTDKRRGYFFSEQESLSAIASYAGA